MSKIEEVQLTVSQLLNDLESGLTWFKSEDAGRGSIQETYGATDREITMIKKHPKLEGVEPRLKVFIIEDDTKGEENDGTREVHESTNRLGLNVGDGKNTSTSKESISEGSNSLVEGSKQVGGMDAEQIVLDASKQPRESESISSPDSKSFFNPDNILETL